MADRKKAMQMAEETSEFLTKMVKLGAGKRELICVIATICDLHHMVTGEPTNELIIEANRLLFEQELQGLGGGKHNEAR